MKYFFIVSILISHGILGIAFADKQAKKVSFGDEGHTYKSHYKKNINNIKRKRTKVERANGLDESDRTMINKPDSSKEFADELEDLNS